MLKRLGSLKAQPVDCAFMKTCEDKTIDIG